MCQYITLKKFATSVLALLLTLLSLQGSSQVLQTTIPEKVGLSSSRLSRIDSVMNDYIKRGAIPGMQVLIARHGKVAYSKAFGKMDPEANKSMPANAMFRIASMSKAITTVAVMTLYEQGYFLLSDPISKYIPEFRHPKVVMKSATSDSIILVPARSEITIRELLNHTSGITYGIGPQTDFYNKAGMTVGLKRTEGTLKEKILALASLPLISHPGEEFHYGMSVDVLGYLVEVISKKPLDEFLKRHIFEPLKMTDTYFSIPANKFSRLASLYKIVKEGKLEKATDYFPYPEPQNYFSGGAGLISTIADYARFAQMLLNKGQLEGVRLLSPRTVDLMTTNSIKDLYIYNPVTLFGIIGDKFGYGFGIRTERGVYDELESIGTYGWDGAFYTRFWIDPKEDMFAIFMSQMEGNWDEPLIGKFKVLVNQAIVE